MSTQDIKKLQEVDKELWAQLETCKYLHGEDHEITNRVRQTWADLVTFAKLLGYDLIEGKKVQA